LQLSISKGASGQNRLGGWQYLRGQIELAYVHAEMALHQSSGECRR
jgi:hypothetical protein